MPVTALHPAVALYRAEKAKHAARAAADAGRITGDPAPEYHRPAPVVVHPEGGTVPRADGRRVALVSSAAWPNGWGAYRIMPRRGED